MGATSFTELELLGTKWPVPSTWKQTAPDKFASETGAFAIETFDGELIDPARCEAAREQHPGDWMLASTVNGMSVCGRVTSEGRLVLQYVSRCARPEGEDWFVPQVQATYAFAASEKQLADEIIAALGVQPMSDADYGLLDVYGHATMGPVPVLTSWEFVGDGDPGPVWRESAPEILMLVGGGFQMLQDPAACCGMLLAPMPWPSFSADLARSAIRGSLKTDVRFMNDGAMVWNQRISETGFSYEAFDPSARTRFVGAFWADPFGQSWQLRYWFGPDHGKATEQRLMAVRDEDGT